MEGKIFNSDGQYVADIRANTIYDLAGKRLYNLRGQKIYKPTGELVGRLNSVGGHAAFATLLLIASLISYRKPDINVANRRSRPEAASRFIGSNLRQISISVAMLERTHVV